MMNCSFINFMSLQVFTCLQRKVPCVIYMKKSENVWPVKKSIIFFFFQSLASRRDITMKKEMNEFFGISQRKNPNDNRNLCFMRIARWYQLWVSKCKYTYWICSAQYFYLFSLDFDLCYCFRCCKYNYLSLIWRNGKIPRQFCFSVFVFRLWFRMSCCCFFGFCLHFDYGMDACKRIVGGLSSFLNEYSEIGNWICIIFGLNIFRRVN